MQPKITLLYTGLLGLFYVALSFNVIRLRRSKLVGLGHDNDPHDPLFRAVRIHGNFSEYIPLLLLMMVLDEMTGRSPLWLHAMGILLLASRVLHMIGITSTHKKSFGRLSGMMITLNLLIISSILLILKGLA